MLDLATGDGEVNFGGAFLTCATSHMVDLLVERLAFNLELGWMLRNSNLLMLRRIGSYLVLQAVRLERKKLRLEKVLLRL